MGNTEPSLERDEQPGHDCQFFVRIDFTLIELQNKTPDGTQPGFLVRTSGLWHIYT
jgi:hypothetical protein